MSIARTLNRWSTDRERKSIRWFRDHEEFAGVYWRQSFRWLPVVQVSACGNDSDEEHLTLFLRWLWFSFNIFLCDIGKEHDIDVSQNWGWYSIDDSIWFWWGKKKFIWDFPYFSAKHQFTEILHPETREVVWKGTNDWKEQFEVQARHSVQLPYHYCTRGWEVQKVVATCNIERRTWERKWFGKPLVRTTLNIKFSDEVGEGRGSWKGGCLGCGFTLLPGESIEECLRRMESTRCFKR